MASEKGVPLRERLAADVFEKSYREYRALRETEYRWRVVALEAVGYLQQAHARHWSLEKLSDYLHSTPVEAGKALERFVMSNAINSQDNTPDRIKTGFEQWLRRFSELGEGERRVAAGELALLVANQLYQAKVAGETLDQVSLELENSLKPDASGPSSIASDPAPPEPPRWGPQWKD